MKLVAWMLGGALLSSFVITVLLGVQTKAEVWIGMTGPLVAAIVDWIILERTYKRHPSALTSVAVIAFAAKMVFFGLFVTLVLRLGSVNPGAFVISFAVYFLGLHVAEAVGLHRLQTSDSRMSAKSL
jgi:hypothetical protein